MLQEVEKKNVDNPYPEADEKPIFAPAFMRVVTDAVYEALHAYLEKANVKPEAIRLLDDLVILLNHRDMEARGKVTWIENQILTEALGAASYDIEAVRPGSLLKT